MPGPGSYGTWGINGGDGYRPSSVYSVCAGRNDYVGCTICNVYSVWGVWGVCNVCAPCNDCEVCAVCDDHTICTVYSVCAVYPTCEGYAVYNDCTVCAVCNDWGVWGVWGLSDGAYRTPRRPPVIGQGGANNPPCIF
jgi:hypothetical protein